MTEEQKSEATQPVAQGSELSDQLGELTLEQIIAARDTKIALLEGSLRFFRETAAENNRIKVEDHNTILRYKNALQNLAAIATEALKDA